MEANSNEERKWGKMADSSHSVSIDMETISLGAKVTRISIYLLVWLPGKRGNGRVK